MAKIKERKSESWKPGVLQDDGFISKNKKRKEKRMSLNLSAKKIDTEEFIPIKKSFLPFNKGKKSIELNSKQTPNKFLSPAFNKQKQTPKQTPKKKENGSVFTPKGKKEPFVSTPGAKKFSIGNISKADTPKNVGTPKKQNDIHSKLAIKKKAQEYIDSEASEGEEPITDKEVKPYVKGDPKRKKSISFKFDDGQGSDSESDDDDEYGSFDDSDDDSDEATNAKDYLDEEASEGEETDDDDDDDDEDDEKESSGEFKNFLIKADEDDESDEDDDESDEDDSSEEENAKPQIKMEKPQIKKEVPALKTENKLPVIANGTKHVKPEKPGKKVKEETETKEKKPKVDAKVIEKKPVINETPAVTTNYIGFVRDLPKTVTEEEIRAQLTTAINVKNIVSVAVKKNNKKKNANCFIYVSDEDSLEKLLNKQFSIGDAKFKVYKARENPKMKRDKPVAFLPRVPLSITNDKVKAAIESDVGPGKIIDLKSKKIAEKFQTRNILLTVADEETLKKIIYKGGYVVDGTEVIVRQAYESGFKVPVYKVVFSEIPEKTTEAILEKAIETSLGKGTVVHVKFSFRKNSFAFVTLKTEEAQKKALQVGNEISIKNSKLKVLEYRPRLPQKRAPPKQKEAPEAKKQKTVENQTSQGTPAESKKVKKQKPVQPTSPKQNQPGAQKKNVQNSPQKDKQQKKKKAKNAPAAIPEKKVDLSKKIEQKKAKLKEKKFKKKQKAGD